MAIPGIGDVFIFGRIFLRGQGTYKRHPAPAAFVQIVPQNPPTFCTDHNLTTYRNPGIYFVSKRKFLSTGPGTFVQGWIES